ncbi:MAG: energy transducer TonB [Candidatus Acidiferrum sp.]
MKHLLTITFFSLTFTSLFSVAAPASLARTIDDQSVRRIRFGGKVMSQKLRKKIAPIYPALARQNKIEGTVRLHLIISTDGTVKQLEVMSGQPLLVQAALDAVRRWEYEPTTLNGDPVEVDTTVDVIFSLKK